MLARTDDNTHVCAGFAEVWREEALDAAAKRTEDAAGSHAAILLEVCPARQQFGFAKQLGGIAEHHFGLSGCGRNLLTSEPSKKLLNVTFCPFSSRYRCSALNSDSSWKVTSSFHISCTQVERCAMRKKSALSRTFRKIHGAVFWIVISRFLDSTRLRTEESCGCYLRTTFVTGSTFSYTFSTRSRFGTDGCGNLVKKIGATWRIEREVSRRTNDDATNSIESSDCSR